MFTGAEKVSDTVKIKHHEIIIPILTPATRIPEAARQLDSTIKQEPHQALMDKLTVIYMLQEVLLVDQRAPLPQNMVQHAKALQKAVP